MKVPVPSDLTSSSAELSVAHYFPVVPPFRVEPGLFRFGTDFGNGEADQRFFSRDSTTAKYLAEKAACLSKKPERFQTLSEPGQDRGALPAIRTWMASTLEREWGIRPDRLGDFASIGSSISEDFAVVEALPDRPDRVRLIHVCFPSGWRPERLLGKSFSAIHAPIPESDALLTKSNSLVRAMVERGPYVRFVWTVSADEHLDHHPEQGQFGDWNDPALPGYLRVERQTTVPFAEHAGSLFLIRTYLYRFDTLSGDQRRRLVAGLTSLSKSMLAYKRLTDSLPLVLARLQAT